MPGTIQKIKGLEVSAVIVRTAGSTDTRRSAEQEHQIAHSETLRGHKPEVSFPVAWPFTVDFIGVPHVQQPLVRKLSRVQARGTN